MPSIRRAVEAMPSSRPRAILSFRIVFASYSNTRPPMMDFTPSLTFSCRQAMCSNTLPDISLSVRFTYSVNFPLSASPLSRPRIPSYSDRGSPGAQQPDDCIYECSFIFGRTAAFGRTLKRQNGLKPLPGFIGNIGITHVQKLHQTTLVIKFANTS